MQERIVARHDVAWSKTLQVSCSDYLDWRPSLLGWRTLLLGLDEVLSILFILTKWGCQSGTLLGRRSTIYIYIIYVAF